MGAKMTRYVDTASVVVITITFVLFVVALFVKGIGQSLLLEAGVFLVSVKLIITSSKLDAADRRLQERMQYFAEQHRQAQPASERD